MRKTALVLVIETVYGEVQIRASPLWHLHCILFFSFLWLPEFRPQVDTVLRLSFGMHVGVGIDRGCELWNGDRNMGRKMCMVCWKFCRADVGWKFSAVQFCFDKNGFVLI
jgi:hypothetical protein